MSEYIQALLVLVGLASATLPLFERERATADATAACCYAALAEDDAKPQPTPKTPALRVLVFSADYCAPCKALHAELTRDLPGKGWKIGSAASDDLEFVEAAKDRDRSKKYDITSVPAVVIIDASGTQKAKVVGGMPSAFLVEWCQKNGKAVAK